MDRRSFLKGLGVAAGCSVVPTRAFASKAGARTDEDTVAVLIDTTKCVGCRSCERACAEANDNPTPEGFFEGEGTVVRTQTTEQFTAVSRYADASAGDKPVNAFVKRQCMHCLEPACTSACLTQALHKTPEGPVVWDGDKCMGCRYCMVSCPFDAPRFEYSSTNPRILKCTMCYDKVAEGQTPACASACPMGAIQFGKRKEMLAEARRRIALEPDSYVDHVYGEHEMGGTGVLYLANRSFEDLGFRTDLGTTPAPEYTREFLYAVPFVITLLPPFMLGLNRATAWHTEGHGDDDGDRH